MKIRPVFLFTFVDGGWFLQRPALFLLVRRRRRDKRQTPPRLHRERFFHYGRAARIAAADDLVVDRLGGRRREQAVAAEPDYRAADGRFPIVVRLVVQYVARSPAKRRYGAGRYGGDRVQGMMLVVTVVITVRRVERAGQFVGQRVTARKAARALPPPRGGPFAAGNRGRPLRAAVVLLVGRDCPFPLVTGLCGPEPGRPSQPDVGQPLGQRRHYAQPIAGAAGDQRAVVHADLVDVPVDQHGRAQIVRVRMPWRPNRGRWRRRRRHRR